VDLIALIALGLAIILGLGAFGLTSLWEGEQRAARVALGLGAAASLPFLLAGRLPGPGRWAVLGLAVVATATAAVLFFLPIGRAAWGSDTPQVRIDERDIMFARARLEPGSANYRAYYALRPEYRAGDDRTRSLPGLLSPDGREAHPWLFAATEVTFGLIETLHGAVDGPIAPDRVQVEPAIMSARVKDLAHYWGARSVGITGLRPYHLYSHVGRGRGEYGAPIELDHRYAIAFAVEMDRDMVGTAPAAPTVLESARQYANAAQVAILLAGVIRSQGYPARAHVDGNYRVVAPLVARDAGLGEIGRMGLLMTPDLGPRVRLGVVTTDLPLMPDRRSVDTSVLDFCTICEKCAANCPVQAIPRGGRQEIDGALRWRIDQVLCYRYWCVAGTDCARCMAVCPYSHAGSPMHNGVRWAARRSGAARRAILWLDGIFYGTRPAPRPAPAWAPPRIDRRGADDGID
jgi:ferredoxin